MNLCCKLFEQVNVVFKDNETSHRIGGKNTAILVQSRLHQTQVKIRLTQYFFQTHQKS
jgi:uncharacterized protein YwbE